MHALLKTTFCVYIKAEHMHQLSQQFYSKLQSFVSLKGHHHGKYALSSKEPTYKVLKFNPSITWGLFYIWLIMLWFGATAIHSSTLAWRIPWMQEPGGLQSVGSLRVGHDWTTSLSLFTFTHWRKKWQSTPVFLPGESQGWRSLVGCRLWGRTELDTTEVT